ncbi:MAG: tetratricopeptide repeat protein [Gemmatimonadota bacterium]
MAAQSIASRPRRQQTEPDDAVLARALQFSEWARRNMVIVVVSAVAIVVLVGGLLWYRADQARQLEEAAIAFLQVEQAVMSGNESLAAQELQLFIQRHGGTPYSEEARVLLGQVFVRGDRAAEAVEVLEPVASELNSSPVGVQAALLQAAAYQAAGDTQAAIETYLEVGEEAEEQFRREEGLVGAALLMQEEGNWAGAAELYARLVEMSEPGSMNRSMFEMRLAEAEARAEQ